MKGKGTTYVTSAEICSWAKATWIYVPQKPGRTELAFRAFGLRFKLFATSSSSSLASSLWCVTSWHWLPHVNLRKISCAPKDQPVCMRFLWLLPEEIYSIGFARSPLYYPSGYSKYILSQGFNFGTHVNSKAGYVVMWRNDSTLQSWHGRACRVPFPGEWSKVNSFQGWR